MVIRPTKNSKPSLFRQHLHIMSIEDGSEPPVEDSLCKDEAESIRSMKLPPLILPQREGIIGNFQKKIGQSLSALQLPIPSYAVLALVAVIVTVSLTLLIPRQETPDSSLRIKGDHRIWLYWEREGQVKTWQRGTILKNGDRLRAEILASVPTKAFLAVINRHDVLLSKVENIYSSELILNAGDRKSFPGSVKLVGKAEGEKFIVALCSQAIKKTDLNKVFFRSWKESKF